MLITPLLNRQPCLYGIFYYIMMIELLYEGEQGNNGVPGAKI